MGWEFKECVILETEDVPVYLGNWRRAQHSSVWQVAAMAAPLYTPSPGRSEMIVLVSVMVWGSGWLILVFNSTWAAQLVSRLEVVATRDTQQPTRTNICQGHPGAQCSLCSTSGIAGLHHHTVTLLHCHTQAFLYLHWSAGDDIDAGEEVGGGGDVTAWLPVFTLPTVHSSTSQTSLALPGPDGAHSVTTRTHQHSPPTWSQHQHHWSYKYNGVNTQSSLLSTTTWDSRYIKSVSLIQYNVGGTVWWLQFPGSKPLSHLEMS